MNENETITLNSDAQIMLNMEYILSAIKLKMNRKKIYEVLKSQHKYTYSYVNFAKRLKKILEEQEQKENKDMGCAQLTQTNGEAGHSPSWFLSQIGR